MLLRRMNKSLQSVGQVKTYYKAKRHPVLLSIEGNYTIDNTYVPIELREYYNEYMCGNRKLKFSRWLIRYYGYSSDLVCRMMQQCVFTPVSFKISCRHNDIMRMSESIHYTSCFSDNREYCSQKLFILGDRDAAICFIPDSSGKFLYRIILYLAVYQSKYALVCDKPYGNGSLDAILQKIEEKTSLTVYKGVIRPNYIDNDKKFFVKAASPIVSTYKDKYIYRNVIFGRSKDNHITYCVYKK